MPRVLGLAIARTLVTVKAFAPRLLQECYSRMSTRRPREGSSSMVTFALRFIVVAGILLLCANVLASAPVNWKGDRGTHVRQDAFEESTDPTLPTPNFTRHAILISGMAVPDAIHCWDSFKTAFTSGGHRLDVYVVLGLGGDGTAPPTAAEQKVIDYYKADPFVKRVHIDRQSINSFSPRLAALVPGFPYQSKYISQPAYRLVLMLWKTYLSWELMVNTTARWGHQYDMVVRLRSDLHNPSATWSVVDLDEYALGNASHDCGRIYYDAWDVNAPHLNASVLSEMVNFVTRGQAVLPQLALNDTRVLRHTIFFPHLALWAAGFNDQFAWGKHDAMRLYFATILNLDHLLVESSLNVAGEGIKKYSILDHMMDEQRRDGSPKPYALEVRPCDRVVYCLAKWYAAQPPFPSTCPWDHAGVRWPAQLVNG